LELCKGIEKTFFYKKLGAQLWSKLLFALLNFKLFAGAKVALSSLVAQITILSLSHFDLHVLYYKFACFYPYQVT